MRVLVVFGRRGRGIGLCRLFVVRGGRRICISRRRLLDGFVRFRARRGVFGGLFGVVRGGVGGRLYGFGGRLCGLLCCLRCLTCRLSCSLCGLVDDLFFGVVGSGLGVRSLWRISAFVDLLFGLLYRARCGSLRFRVLGRGVGVHCGCLGLLFGLGPLLGLGRQSKRHGG